MGEFSPHLNKRSDCTYCSATMTVGATPATNVPQLLPL